jgi:hypothetical protein
MAALQALRPAAGATARNPVLFVVAAAFGLLQLPGILARTIDPLVGSLVSLAISAVSVFVVPLFFAGIVGMANEALDGHTSLGAFLREGTDHYLSVFVVYLILFAVNVVLGAVGFLVAVFGGVLFLAGEGSVDLVPLVILGVVGAVVVIAYLLVVFFTQFFGHAIVVDDLGAVDGLKRSAWCVRHSLTSVLGYSILVGAGGALFGVVAGAFSLLTAPTVRDGRSGLTAPAPGGTPVGIDVPSLGPAGVAALAAVFLVASGLFGGFFAAYSTAFYRRIRPAA